MYINAETEREFEYIRSQKPEVLQTLMQELEAKLLKNRVSLWNADKPIPTQLNEVVLTRTQSDALSHDALTIMSAINKVVRAYYTDTTLQKLLSPSAFEQALFLNTKEPIGLNINRLDAFWDGNGFKFIELNADFPDGILLLSKLHAIRKQLFTTYNMEEKLSYKAMNDPLHLTNTMRATSIMCDGPQNPHIAVLGPKGRAATHEYEHRVEFFRSQGCNANWIEPHEMMFDDTGALLVENKKVDIIHRAAEIRYFEDSPNAKPLFQAYQSANVVMVNSFHNRLRGIKGIFAILTDTSFETLFSQEEKDVIARTIPHTDILQPKNIDEILKRDKDTYVLKPQNLSEGDGILFGRETTPETWESELRARVPDQWIVQELVNITKRPVVNVIDGEIATQELYSDFFVHLYQNEESEYFVGTIGNRTSETPIVNVAKGGGVNATKILL